MSILSETWHLLRKEVVLELRNRYALGGILLYVVSTIFIVYIAFIRIEPPVWNVLFWIIVLFSSVNAIVKSFVQESGHRQLYYYQLAHPIAFLLSKILYNALLLLVLSGLCFAAFSFVAGNPVQNGAQFALAVFLGSLGFSVTFTFVSSIAAKASQSSTLMAILSFPVVLPILLVLVKISAQAIGMIPGRQAMDEVLILLAIDALLVGLGMVLFPYLWRD